MWNQKKKWSLWIRISFTPIFKAIIAKEKKNIKNQICKMFIGSIFHHNNRNTNKREKKKWNIAIATASSRVSFLIKETRNTVNSHQFVDICQNKPYQCRQIGKKEYYFNWRSIVIGWFQFQNGGKIYSNHRHISSFFIKLIL